MVFLEPPPIVGGGVYSGSMTIGAGDDALLARARTMGVEVRQLDFARLVLVAQLEADNVAVVRGYKTTGRMLEDFWLMGPAEAKRIVTHARLLCGDTTLSGQPWPGDAAGDGAGGARR